MDSKRYSLNKMNLNKISTDQLRERFDNDVERFSDAEKGQQTIVDAALSLETVETAIQRMHPNAEDFCDIGCGGGNYSVRITRKLPQLAVTLVDLSQPMLDRASERLTAQNIRVKEAIQGDIKEIRLKPESLDIALASASLHHLRTHEDWRRVFAMVYRSLRPGGSFWICDIIKHENVEIEAGQRERYARFLADLKDKEFQETIFEMIERTDTPETIDFQMQTLRDVGFRHLDIVHKNMLFFVLVARKTS